MLKKIACLIALAALTAGTARADNAGFYRDLLKKKTATFGDACRTMLTLKEKKDPGAAPYEELHARARKAGLIEPDWNFKADSPLTKGQVSYMVFKALKLKGGFTLRLFGVSRRYALRECADLGIIKGGESQRYVTGGELMAILSRANQYRETGTVHLAKPKPSTRDKPEPMGNKAGQKKDKKEKGGDKEKDK